MFRGSIKPLINQRFNRLVIQHEAPRNQYKQRMVQALCDCGQIKIMPLSPIVSGRTFSCGCYQRQRSSQVNANKPHPHLTSYANNRLGKRDTEVGQKYPESYNKCRGSFAANTIYQIKQKAKQRNKLWSINDLEAFELCLQPCVYCGATCNWPESRNGIDRVDNDLGYESGNCVSCCFQCNSAKAQLSVEQFKQYIILLYRKLCAPSENSTLTSQPNQSSKDTEDLA